MLGDVVGYLACPVCEGEVALESDSRLLCLKGHAFDVARQGYVTMLRKPYRGAADTLGMVQARATFLAGGHYDFLANAITAAARSIRLPQPGCMADIGGGTGFYLRRLLESLTTRDGIVVDVSRQALRLAARCHPRAGAVRSNTWDGLPLRSGSVALLLSVFAPRHFPEFVRVLARDGALILVTPTGRHLREIVDALDLLRVEEAKDERLTDQMASLFWLDRTETIEHELQLAPADLAALVSMGPSAWHVQGESLRVAISRLPSDQTVTASVRIRVFRPAHGMS